ncbi:MAG: peroxiredoxin [Sphingomonadaceae bacterium]|nr:peroxiredoxin [Sphingomonadaceae bacterium]
MRRAIPKIAAVLIALSTLSAWPLATAQAALATGAPAPLFTLPAAQGGERLTLNLANLLRQGPVVVYFFPRAFTAGCTIESRAFAEAAADFRAAGATIIGLSADDIDTLQRFSTQECRSAFPMAAATPNVIAGYDVLLRQGITTRTSYVIAQDGTISMVHNDMNPNDHVRLTLAEVRRLHAARR